MSAFFSVFSYGPILRGFLALLIAGASLPIAGAFVLRLNLIPLRFTLMHGALLGGAVALAAGLDPLFLGILLDVLIVLIIAPLSRYTGLQTGYVTAFLMVVTVGTAFAVIYKANVPAKDAFEILWGNLYAVSWRDLFILSGFAVAVFSFIMVFFGRIAAVLYDRDIAFISGVNDRLLMLSIMLVTGLSVAFAMRLIGALLLDSILLLPAITASLFANSMKRLFVSAAVLGVITAVAGFFVSLGLDLPASSAVTLSAAVLLGGGFIIRRRTG